MACTDVQTIQAGNGSKTQFSFDFPYIFKSEIHVYFWNAVTKEYDEKLTTDSTYPWRITDANPTIVEFTGSAPPSPATPVDPGESTVDNVKIRRITKVDDIRALFNPGSAIRSDDLNKNFEQLRYAVQESNCQGIPDDVDQYLKDYYWDNFDETVYSTETWVSSDAKIATTAAMDQRFQDEATETYSKAELAADNNVIPDDDAALPTTGAVKDYVDHVVETDILVNSTGLEKTSTGGQVTIGIAEGSVDLDRIKPADIITSSEANPNNDTTIATTAKIDDMIDAAITGDIAGTDGVSITDDGDGTITIGLTNSSVDLDKIKDDDKITYAEQNAGSPAPADSNIFTASAAAQRFDTLVQTTTPAGSNWETGKTWLQNDDDQTLKVWNGTAWLDVASGGSFRTQDKVIYVDATGGDDSKSGHRISGPKLTIKGAIADINADISTSIKTAGSGYADANYTNVPLTGGTTGSGLQANITVSGGAVTACTVTSSSTLEEYQIGDILSASDSNLGGNGGSGFELEVTGGGDGMTVIVAAGVYQEAAPIQIKRRNVSIIGMALRSTIVHPTVATEKPSNPGNSALFELNSGSFLQNLTLTGMQASNSGTNTIDSVLPDKQGWNFAFYNNAYITKSPYIQNCTNFSDSEIDNSDLRAHRPRGGSGGDTDSAPTGGGMLVDGSVPKSTSPLRSMVADSYTHVGLNGPGLLVTNNGYAQCTSSYAFFNKYHIKALNGGQANLAASTTDFGAEALVADGKSTTAIFTSTVDGAASDGATTFNINAPTAGTGWFGAATRPGSNMLVTVNSITYPVLSAVANGSGWTVTISRPNPNLRSDNLGLNGAIADGAAVSFFLRSMIASSGHTMEYVGSGTNYNALPENGGVPDDSKQVVESNNGKVWTATTDHNGKFSVGDFFQADQRTGFVSFSAGSVAFDVVTDSTPQLGGQLDALTNKIVNLGTPSSSNDAATKGYVDGLSFASYTDTTANFTGTLQNGGSNVVVDSDIGSTVQAYDADTAKLDAGIANFTGTLQNQGSNVLVHTDLGASVQAYDADTTKNDVANTFVPAQTFTAQSVHNGGIDVNGNIDVSGNIVAQGTLDLTDNLTISDKIIHSGDTSTRIRFPAQGTFAVETNGSERIRVTSTGAVAVGGASNYGTSGQVLTSNGNGAPTWQDAAGGGGGEYDFVASGAIANGDTVVVNSNGTVSVIAESGAGAPSTGTAERFSTINITESRATYDSYNNKVVVVYRASDNSGLYAVVGTLSGMAISFGSAVLVHSGNTGSPCVTFDSQNNKIVICYWSYENYTYYVKAVVGTVSGTSISFGSKTTLFSGGYLVSSSITFDSSNNKVVFCYARSNNNFYGEAQVGTVSGTSISFGSSTVFRYVSTSNIAATFDSSNNKVVVGFQGYVSNVYIGQAVVGTVSSTSISFGSAVTFESAAPVYTSATFDSNSNKVVFAYQDSGNSNRGTAVVGTVSGTSISFGTNVVFDTADTRHMAGIAFDSANNKVIIGFYDDVLTDSAVIVGTVSGTSISFGTQLDLGSGGRTTQNIVVVYAPDLEKSIISFFHGAGLGDALVFRTLLKDTNLTTENYVGIAAEAISSGATGKINIAGGVNEGQSGLTAGQRYYVRNDGSLSLNLVDQDVVAGTSISATKLIVKG